MWYEVNEDRPWSQHFCQCLVCFFLPSLSLSVFLHHSISVPVCHLCSLLRFLAGAGRRQERRVAKRTDRQLISLLWAQTGQCWSPICLETEQNTVTNISFLAVLFSFFPSLRPSLLPSLSACRTERKNLYSHIHQLSVLSFTFLSWHCCTLSLPLLFCFCLSSPVSAHLSLPLRCPPLCFWTSQRSLSTFNVEKRLISSGSNRTTDI